MIRKQNFGCLLVLLVLSSVLGQQTLYEYYTSDGISSGLSVDNPYFTLNNKNISIYSGTVHYFRVPRQYWRDRLKKVRAAGLNAVESYVAWNLHEPQNGVFDFGDGGSDFEDFLHLEEFLQIAQEEDLFVIIRPGPYICAEWEWGGFPSWLLREDGLRVRENEPKYLEYVSRYFNTLLPILAKYQFTQGGPIIAVQVENEYGSYGNDRDYLQALVDLLNNNGIVELLVSSDGSGSGTSGSIPGTIFQTVNFGDNPEGNFDALKGFQPGKPIMAMEYWTGWYDFWNGQHSQVSDDKFKDLYTRIVNYPASVNMYMFFGGTNFGFLGGANYNSEFQPMTTSYDYDAPLTENGDYTGKYDAVREILQEYNANLGIQVPDPPELTPRTAYSSINIDGQLSYEEIIDRAPFTQMSDEPLVMELLSLNNNSGQSYGYIVYRQENIDLPANSKLKVTAGFHDTCVVMVNGQRISGGLQSSADLDSFGFWRMRDPTITLNSEELKGASLDLIVSNLGRVNFGGIVNEKKGMKDENIVTINGEVVSHWLNIPLEFKRSWNEQLSGWNQVTSADDLIQGPALYHAVLTIDGDPQDTFINMEDWAMGAVIVNGFVLGRHFRIGPQQALYLPAPFLKSGDNEIVIFEQFTPQYEVKFSDHQIFANN